jgi:hypothetical protein
MRIIIIIIIIIHSFIIIIIIIIINHYCQYLRTRLGHRKIPLPLGRLYLPLPCLGGRIPAGNAARLPSRDPCRAETTAFTPPDCLPSSVAGMAWPQLRRHAGWAAHGAWRTVGILVHSADQERVHCVPAPPCCVLEKRLSHRSTTSNKQQGRIRRIRFDQARAHTHATDAAARSDATNVGLAVAGRETADRQRRKGGRSQSQTAASDALRLAHAHLQSERP